MGGSHHRDNRELRNGENTGSCLAFSPKRGLEGGGFRCWGKRQRLFLARQGLRWLGDGPVRIEVSLALSMSPRSPCVCLEEAPWDVPAVPFVMDRIRGDEAQVLCSEEPWNTTLQSKRLSLMSSCGRVAKTS